MLDRRERADESERQERARAEHEAADRYRTFCSQSIDQTQLWITKALSFAVAIGAGHPEVALKWAVDAEDLPLARLSWLGDAAAAQAYLDFIVLISERTASGAPWSQDDQRAYAAAREKVVTALSEQRQRMVAGEPLKQIPDEVVRELASVEAMIGVMWPAHPAPLDAGDIEGPESDAPRDAKAGSALGPSARDVPPPVLPGRAEIRAALLRAAVMPPGEDSGTVRRAKRRPVHADGPAPIDQ
jgi:hypothetical protein